MQFVFCFYILKFFQVMGTVGLMFMLRQIEHRCYSASSAWGPKPVIWGPSRVARAVTGWGPRGDRTGTERSLSGIV